MSEPADVDNVVAISKDDAKSDKPAKPAKKFRKLKILSSEDGQFYYVSVDKKGEPVYTSETFTRKGDAIRAARREHEGRNEKFDYILEYENANGNLIRETL